MTDIALSTSLSTWRNSLPQTRSVENGWGEPRVNVLDSGIHPLILDPGVTINYPTAARGVVQRLLEVRYREEKRPKHPC